MALKLPELAQGRSQHLRLADEGGDEDRIQDLVLARPRLRVTREADGALIPRDDRPYVDLRTRADLDITGIVSVGAAI